MRMELRCKKCQLTFEVLSSEICKPTDTIQSVIEEVQKNIEITHKLKSPDCSECIDNMIALRCL